MSKLIIRQYAGFTPRPAFSYKIREYFEQLVLEELLIPSKIIVNGKFEIWLELSFVDYYKPTDKRVEMIYKPATYTRELIKTYAAFLNYPILLQSTNYRLTYIEMIVETIELFFTRFYKKIKTENFMKMNAKIDYDYLMSLPYPASFEEQQYAMDDSGNMQKFMQETPHLLNLSSEMGIL